MSRLNHLHSGLDSKLTRAKRNQLTFELLENRRLLANSSAYSPTLDFPSLEVSNIEYDSSRILVRFRDESVHSVHSIDSLDLTGKSTEVNSFDFFPGLAEIVISGDTSLQETIDSLRAHPDVLYAEPDFRVQLQAVPNDPSFNRLWGMNNLGQTGGVNDSDIDAVEAWDVTTGGGSMIVAIVDTGVDYTHPDLAANIWTNDDEVPGNGRDDDNNGYVDDIHGYDFVNGDGDPRDDHFHGTHVAGTIGAVGNNGIGVAGVNWNVRIMALKFLDSYGGGYISDAISALNYAVANGAKVSNHSWGGGGYSQAMFDAIQAASTANHIFVAAAGNESSDNDQFPAYPASYELPNIISVAALDHSDQLAYFTNVGAQSVDVGAPGVDIVSTFPTYLTPAMQNDGFQRNYESISGTSMATPHVAGLAALVYDQHPEWSATRVIEQILGTVEPIDALRQTTTGGRINAAAAVGNPVPDQRGPRVTRATPTGVASRSVSEVKLTFNEPIAPGSFTIEDVARFVGPGGENLLGQITGVSGTGRDFTIAFPSQSALGSYEMTIGPAILDESGNPMDQNSNGSLGETPQDQYLVRFTLSDSIVFPSNYPPVPIYDWTSSVSYLNIDQDLFIGDLDVEVNITHTYDADLYVYLVSPEDPSSRIALVQSSGGEGNNFADTVFDDEADLAITQGSPPFTGRFRPEQSLAQLDGQNARGVWELWVEDYGWFDQGQINSWSLTIQPGDGVINPINRPPEAIDDYGQTNEDTAVTISVLANDRDRNGDPLTVTSVSDAFSGRAVLNADNTVTFTPDPNFNSYYGSAGFLYTISDGRGGTASAYVWIDVLPVNDAPVAVDDSVDGSRNQPVVFSSYYGLASSSLESNDTDVDGDWLWVASVSNARNGTVSIGFNGEVIFTPTRDFVGTASFEYTVTDGSLQDVGLVQIDLSDIYYLATGTNGSLTNSDGSIVQFSRSDVLQLSVGANGSFDYSLYFDGSDVGLTTVNESIDAFTIMPDGSLLISTVGAFSVASYGYSVAGRGEDLLQFWPQSAGSDTAGYWNLYFDGSNVGLAGTEENIDAVSVLSDGRLLISTSGQVRVPGVPAGADEDLLVFTPYSFGEGYTSGTWAMYFDGSDVGLAESDDEDIDGLYVRENPAGGLPMLYFSTRGAFDANGITGANEDILAFQPTRLGGTTVGTYQSPLALDGSLLGLADQNIVGFYIGRATSSSSEFPISSLDAQDDSFSSLTLRVGTDPTRNDAVDSIMGQLNLNPASMDPPGEFLASSLPGIYESVEKTVKPVGHDEILDSLREQFEQLEAS